MGKGEEDARIIVDTDSTGTRWAIDLHLWDDLDDQDVPGLLGAAASGQQDFDQEAGQLWPWYSGRSQDFRARLRMSFLAL